jgi:hypothetical protein
MVTSLAELKRAAVAPREVTVKYSSHADALWDQLEETKDGCWEWRGGSSHGWGYGLVHHKEKGRQVTAHRLAWELVNGSIPKGMLVCHRCDNPPCCNPAHLWLGTMQDNQADKVQKGRNYKPERVGTELPWAKLNEDDIRAIRWYRRELGMTYNEIARIYGVVLQTIAHIYTGKTWTHVA